MPTGCPRPSNPPEVRLHKYLAECGVGSRRACEKLIAGGAVSVDGKAVTAMGVRIHPDRQAVRVMGRCVAPQGKIHLVLNKPRDVICTSSDPAGRRTFKDLLPPLPARVYTVGRLDRGSEGLLLVTNDGELAVRLTHPRHEVPKTYRVWIEGLLSDAECGRMLGGIASRGEKLNAGRVTLVGSQDGVSCYEVVLREGRNRQVRRMVEATGHAVRRLVRTRIGPLTLAGLRSGGWRHLAPGEVVALRNASGLRSGPSPGNARGCSGSPPPAKAGSSCRSGPSRDCSP